MRDRILRAMAHMPAGGIALHGTSYKKALSIAKTGLTDNGYITLVPNPKYDFFKADWESQRLYSGAGLPTFNESEFLSRTIGSILFSAAYSFSKRHVKSAINPNGERNPEPAMVVFAAWTPDYPPTNSFNLLGNDIETSFWRILPTLQTRHYFSFGKTTYNVMADYVCAIARLSKSDMERIASVASSRSRGHEPSFNIISERLSKDALILKTLQLIEQLTFLENKPSEILLL